MSQMLSQNLKLGILGGGQLGRMLIQSALNFDITTFVLDQDDHAPSRSLCTHFVQGSFNDFDTVYNFGKNVDVLTIEIENVNVDALKKLESEGVKVYPQASVIEIIQDKGLQKQFMADHGLPTIEFMLVVDAAELRQHASFLPAFQKLRKSGYDGRGVFRLNSVSDFDKAFGAPSVLEKAVDFDKEISVVVARNARGEIATYPVVEMAFHPTANLVEFLFCPSKLNPKIQRRADELARQAVEALQLVGLLAVEMFVTKTGEVLINEMAPRPHNSAHHTIEANVTSQFEQVLRAIFNWPLGDTGLRKPAVMVNVLGSDGHQGEARYAGLDQVLNVPDVHLHLYGKKFTKPFRKMGHVTVMAETLEKAIETARFVKNTLKVVT